MMEVFQDKQTGEEVEYIMEAESFSNKPDIIVFRFLKGTYTRTMIPTYLTRNQFFRKYEKKHGGGKEYKEG